MGGKKRLTEHNLREVSCSRGAEGFTWVDRKNPERRKRKEGRKASLIPFIIAGMPFLESSTPFLSGAAGAECSWKAGMDWKACRKVFENREVVDQSGGPK